MAIRWDFREKVGTCQIEQNGVEYTFSLYEGNAFLIFLYEWTDEEGNGMYSMHNFFAELEDGIPYHDVMLDVRDAVSEALNRSLLMNVDVGKLSNYEEMKRSLMVQLVSTEKNKEMLSRVPHKEMADMSMIYRFDLGDTGNSNATILVTNQMLQNYGE